MTFEEVSEFLLTHLDGKFKIFREVSGFANSHIFDVIEEYEYLNLFIQLTEQEYKGDFTIGISICVANEEYADEAEIFHTIPIKFNFNKATLIEFVNKYHNNVLKLNSVLPF